MQVTELPKSTVPFPQLVILPNITVGLFDVIGDIARMSNQMIATSQETF